MARALFGSDPAVLAVLDQAIAAMRDGSATVEEVTVPDLAAITGFEFEDHLTRYLAGVARGLQFSSECIWLSDTRSG